MNQLAELIEDLEELNKTYLGLLNSAMDAAPSIGQLHLIKDPLIESGELVIDFYQSIFKQRYAPEKGPIFREAKDLLLGLSQKAAEAASNSNYFALGVLMCTKSSFIGEPTVLEKFIERAKAGVTVQ